MVTVKVVITVSDTENKFAYCRVGIREEANLAGDTWKSRMAKKLCFEEMSPLISLPFPKYEELCRNGRQYAKKKGLTFVNQLL